MNPQTVTTVEAVDPVFYFIFGISAVMLIGIKTREEIDTAMSGNICRCGTYTRIRDAIHRAAEDKS